MTKRILAPYGVNPKDLKQHLINIGFTPQKDTKDEKINIISFFQNYTVIKEFEEVYDYTQEYKEEYNYNKIKNDYYEFLKEDLQYKIDYSLDCLIEPHDNGIIDYDAMSEGGYDKNANETEIIDDNDDYSNYENYDEYSYRRFY